MALKVRGGGRRFVILKAAVVRKSLKKRRPGRTAGGLRPFALLFNH